MFWGVAEDAAEGDKSAGKRKSMASAFAKIVGKKSKGSAGPILAVSWPNFQAQTDRFASP